MSSGATDEATMEAAHLRVLELFGAVCGDPDNQGLAADADQALQRLDELLSAARAPGR